MISLEVTVNAREFSNTLSLLCSYSSIALRAKGTILYA
jgi:hypothetical protein